MNLVFLLCFLFIQRILAIDVSVTHATFKSPEQAYVEIYLHVVGKTVEFMPIDSSSLQAAVEFMILFKKGDKVVKYDKFLLNSPVAVHPINFIDLKRYSLENGKYDLEVIVTDANKEENTVTIQSEVKLTYSDLKLQQSDIQLLTSYHKAGEGENSPLIKNGYFLESLPFGFYGKNASHLIFYNEIYNSDKEIGADYMISYSIEKDKGNNRYETVMIGHKRRKPKAIDAVLLQMDIGKLPSGNYNLLVEVRDRTKALLNKKSVFFQRSNPYLNVDPETMATMPLEEEFVNQMNHDELRYALKSIAPLVPDGDVELINILIKEKKEKAMRLYLFSYWANNYPNNPHLAYLEFMKVADYADKVFKSGFGYGFETDRGRIFIRYGRPTDVVTVEDDPAAPPYEIWSYNDFPMTQQSNVKFIFFNPSLAAGNYLLLHSNARGEINNPRWEVDLYSQSPGEIDGTDYFGGTQMQDNMGRRARRLFNDF